MSDITGEVLRGRYQIERLLGRGGMADVYLAFDMHRQTHVALKVIREDLADDADFIRRFSREAAALARLDHPNVVRFYATEQDGAVGFIVMDYVPGTTLQRRIAQAGGPLPLSEVSTLLHQIGPALHYAHSLGFIHRDIKPANIMLREDGTALLSDFGAARVAETATLSSITIGTPAYMSPEQILGRELTAQSDIYSFGLVLYEMLAGRRPFTGDEIGLTGTGTISRLREAHLRLDPPNLAQLNPAVTPGVADVVLKALAKDLPVRWPNLVSLMEAWDATMGKPARRGKAAVASQAAVASAETIASPMPGSVAYTGSASPTSLQAPTGQQAAPAAQTPASQPVSQPVSRPLAPAIQPKGRRGLWIGLGLLIALIAVGVVAWQFVLPSLATARTASETNPGAATATADAASRAATSEAEIAVRAATATANGAAEVALQQRLQQMSTAEAQSTAAASRLAETATAAGRVVEQAAAIEATSTAQSVLSSQATGTAVAAATQSAQEAAATATAEADLAAQAAATAAADATAAAAAQATAQAQPKATAAPQPKATVAPVQPAAPGVVADFERAATWQRGDQPYGSLERSTEQAQSGSASAKLTYDFPAVAGNFVVFRARPALALAGQPTGLTAWVYGDGSGHFLNAWLQDSAGQVRQYTFGRISHQGWQEMTAWFDDSLGWPNVRVSGPDSGKLGYPAQLWGLVLDGVPDEQASQGVIYIDDVRTVTDPIPQGTPAAAASSRVAGAAAPTGGGAPSAPVGLGGKLAVGVYAPERGAYDLYVGTAAGDGVQRVLDFAGQAALSPGGSQVAYRRWKLGDRGLAVMPAGGGSAQRQTQFLEDALPSWSPDGKTLVFASRRESDRKARIYQMSLGGGSDWVVKRGADPVFGEYPTWQPDGTIVYKSNYPEQGLVVINADGSGARTLVADGSATAPAGTSRGPYVAFMSQRDGNWEIYRVGLDGNGVVRLTNSPGNDGLPAWSPDGSALAFVSDRDGSWGVWVMAADGSGQRKLFDLPGAPDGRIAAEPDYSNRGWLEERLSWSR